MPKPHPKELCDKCKALGKSCVPVQGRPKIIAAREYLARDKWRKGKSYKEVNLEIYDRLFGFYYCPECDDEWTSANSWRNYKQECKDCKRSVKAYRRTLHRQCKWEELLDKDTDEYFVRYYSKDSSEYYDEYYDRIAMQYFIRNYEETGEYYDEYYDEKSKRFFVRNYDENTEGIIDDYYE